MKINRKKCTETVAGRVAKITNKGIDFPTVIFVEYQVDGNIYTVSESIKLKSKMIKLGFLPIGQKKVPVMGNTAVGSIVSVSYNPMNPAESYITDNIGSVNI